MIKIARMKDILRVLVARARINLRLVKSEKKNEK